MTRDNRKQQCRPLAFGQFRYGVTGKIDGITRDRLPLGVRSRIGPWPVRIELRLVSPRPPSCAIDTQIDDDTVQPRGEPGPTRLPLSCMAPETHKRLLCHFFGILRSPQESIRKRMCAIDMTADERRERTLVTVPSGRDEGIVVT